MLRLTSETDSLNYLWLTIIGKRVRTENYLNTLHVGIHTHHQSIY